MKTRSLAMVTLAVALALLPAAVFAQNSVSLAPSTQQVAANQPVAVHVDIAFAQQAIGGGIIVAFPSALSFSSFTWHPSFPDDPSLRLVCPSAHPACQDFDGPGVLIAFASDGSVNPPIQGAHRVGTLSFVTTNSSATLVPRQDDSGIAGPFVGTGAFAAPSMNGAYVVVPGTVPALSGPAHAVLIALILSAALLGARHRKQAIG